MEACSGVPTSLANTSSCSFHSGPAASRSSAWRARWERSASATTPGRLRARRDFGVLVPPRRSFDRHPRMSAPLGWTRCPRQRGKSSERWGRRFSTKGCVWACSGPPADAQPGDSHERPQAQVAPQPITPPPTVLGWARIAYRLQPLHQGRTPSGYGVTMGAWLRSGSPLGGTTGRARLRRSRAVPAQPMLAQERCRPPVKHEKNPCGAKRWGRF